MFSKCKIIFLDNCELCGSNYDIRERMGKEINICKKCVISKLEDTGCRAISRHKCENDGCKNCYYKSFVSHEKSKFWSARNKIEAKNVSLNSKKKFWFTCEECRHDFETVIFSINKGTWCPFCKNKRRCDVLDCAHCFNNSFASHEKAAHWNFLRNNYISPRNVSLNSNGKFWFTCEKCEHDFEIVLNSVSRGGWCSFCNNKKRCDIMNCDKCFNNSFASCEKSRYWCYAKNNGITPRDVAKHSNEKFWFKCEECKHDFELSPDRANNDYWCGFCDNKKRCDDLTCVYCFNHSFAKHEKAKYWNHLKNGLSPREIALNTGQKFWFTCEKCGHDIKIGLNKINAGRWCAFCINKKRCNDMDCDKCFNNSFAKHEKAKYWNYNRNNGISPRDVALNNTDKFWFTCEECKADFEMSPHNINNGGSWCPLCKHKTEKLVVSYVMNNGINILHRFAPDWCRNPKTGKHFPFDSCIEGKKIIIEIDGPQHFEIMKHWNSFPKENLDRDIYKMNQALKNGYSIIRIYQPDVFDNSYDWKTDLMTAISNCESINIYYLSQNPNIYDKHRAAAQIIK
jgi:hypothetical protein